MSFSASTLWLLWSGVAGEGVPLWLGWADSTESFRSAVSVIGVGGQRSGGVLEVVELAYGRSFSGRKERPGLRRLLRGHGGRSKYEAIRIFVVVNYPMWELVTQTAAKRCGEVRCSGKASRSVC